MGAPLDLGGERVGHRARQMRAASRRIDHADQARAPAGQGHQRERAGLGVEFGRGVVVRPRVTKIERQRGLRIGPAVGRDAGGRRHSERRPSAPITSAAVTPATCPSAIDDAAVLDRDRLRRVLDDCERSRAPGRAPRARRGETGSRYCSRTRRARFRRRRNELPARAAAGAVSSTMRMMRSGAACSRQCGQTPSVRAR